MAINCEDIVNWLKNWFKPRNEDYAYDITVSNYNPQIDSTITIGVTVTDGNNNIVDNHTFQLWIGDDTPITLTTDNDGEASYTYTCDEWGEHKFSIKEYTAQITTKGYKLIETVETNDLTIRTYTDGIRVVYAVTGTTTIQQGILTGKLSYPPIADITIELNPSNGNNGARLRIATDGKMQFIKNSNTSTTCEAQSSATTFLASTLY